MYPNWVIPLVIGAFLLGALIGGLIVRNNMKRLKSWEAYPAIAREAIFAYLDDLKDVPQEVIDKAKLETRRAMDSVKLYIESKL